MQTWWTRRESNSRLCNANAALYHLTTGPFACGKPLTPAYYSTRRRDAQSSQTTGDQEYKRRHDEDWCDTDKRIACRLGGAVHVHEPPYVEYGPYHDENPVIPCRVHTKQYTLPLSGRRESDSDYMTPSHAYYHYTTARCGASITQTLYLSGCWESNPVYTHPKRAYYRYTTARSLDEITCGDSVLVHLIGFEPMTFRM